MNVIEKLEKLCIEYEGGALASLAIVPDLRAIIEEYKAAEKDPFGYFKAEPFGWTDCAETDEGAIALYENPPLSNETVKDAAIGKLVREKMQSGNDVPVSRCTITRTEFDEAMKEINA